MNPNDLFTAGPSSTAAELTLVMEETDRRLAPYRAALQGATDKLIVMTFGREVCARRARKLRRRGERVVFTRRTGPGKARFRWIARIKFDLATVAGR